MILRNGKQLARAVCMALAIAATPLAIAAPTLTPVGQASAKISILPSRSTASIAFVSRFKRARWS